MKIALNISHLPTHGITMLRRLGITQPVEQLPRNHPVLVRVVELLIDDDLLKDHAFITTPKVVEIDATEFVILFEENGLCTDLPGREYVITPSDPRWTKAVALEPLTEAQEALLKDELENEPSKVQERAARERAAQNEQARLERVIDLAEMEDDGARHDRHDSSRTRKGRKSRHSKPGRSGHASIRY